MVKRALSTMLALRPASTRRSIETSKVSLQLVLKLPIEQLAALKLSTIPSHQFTWHVKTTQ
jgi:hypothetical protein